MENRKKFFLIFVFIVVDAFLIIGFLVIRDATNINQLNKEMEEIYKLNISTDRFDRKIKTHGGYGVVEEAIKNRLDHFSVEIQEITEMVNDPKLSKVLSYDNYNGDGPEFRKSLTYLEESSSKFNSKIDELLKEMEDSEIEEYIYTKTDDKYYISLYKKYMSDDNIMSDIHEARDLLNKTKVRMNNLFDVSTDVLNFLTMYPESWKLEDGEIKFQTEELYNYYMSLISKVQVS